MFQCPRCRSSDYLVVDLQIQDAIVDRDGELVEVLGRARFDPMSRMYCGECKFDGLVSEFQQSLETNADTTM
jgi:hypothetical protein